MTTIGAHRTYDLADLSAGIARTDRRDQILDRVYGAAVTFLTGTSTGIILTLACMLPWT